MSDPGSDPQADAPRPVPTGKGSGSISAKGAFSSLMTIMSVTSRKQHILFAITVVLMLVGGVAEIMSIGSVVPMLAFLIDVDASNALPPVIAGLFERIVGGEGERSVVAAGIFMIVAAVVAASVRLLLTWCSLKFVTGVGHELGTHIFRTMLSQPYEVHVMRNSSDVVSAVEKVQNVIFGVLYQVVLSVSAVVIGTSIAIFLVMFSPVAAAVAISAMIAVYLVISLLSRRVLRNNSVVLAYMQTRRIQDVQEAVGGIRDIIISRTQDTFYESFRGADKMFRHAQGVNIFLQWVPRFVVEGAGIVLLALYAIYLSLQPGGLNVAVPVIGAMAFGAQRLLPMLQQVYSGWSALQGSQQMLRDVEYILDIKEHRAALPPPDQAIRFEREMAFENISFSYARSPSPVFSDVSLTIEKGSRIGVVGKTGSGKSTLVDLFMGLLLPTDGQITIDGKTLTAGNRISWYALITHVPQSIYLADTSIAANIALSAEGDGIDRERMERAAEIAQLREYIDTLPDGYETSVGERGVRLSGGQRQRLGLARAFYMRASVLVLDEATSALDSDTEDKVMRALDALEEKITIIMVTHRLRTLRNCDSVITVGDSGVEMTAGPPPREAMEG